MSGEQSGDPRHSLGRRGEKIARRHLESLGYEALEVNFRSKIGEIDLVAEDKGTLVFVEVRTKLGRAFGSAAESVNFRKRSKLITVAQTYLAKQGTENRDWRIDVVAVEVDGQDIAAVEVLKNAVEA